MNLETMLPMLRSRVGNPSIVDAPDNKLTEVLNLALHDVSGRYRFHKARKRCRFDTVVGQAGYGLPPDCEAVYTLQDITNFRKLSKIGAREYSSRDDDTLSDTRGKPCRYIRYRDSVDLLPIPDGVYTIEVFYKYFVVDLVAPTDVPGIPASWHYGIVLMAIWHYYTDQADGPKKQAAYEDFKLWVSDKPTEIDEESVDIDSGVDVLTLSQKLTPRQDFNHAD